MLRRDRRARTAGRPGCSRWTTPTGHRPASPSTAREWLKVYRDIDDADEDQLVVYHSHTATEAYPSRTDVLWSRTTEFQHWLLVSTRSDEDEVRSYVITDGEVVEEELRITPAGMSRRAASCSTGRRPYEHWRSMSIEVRIPTILRTYTGGEKAVSAQGDTLQGLIDDLDSRHSGIKDRLITSEGALHRFVNVYVNDEDVRFLGSLETPLKDGDSVTVLPAVAGG